MDLSYLETPRLVRYQTSAEHEPQTGVLLRQAGFVGEPWLVVDKRGSVRQALYAFPLNGYSDISEEEAKKLLLGGLAFVARIYALATIR